MIRAILASALVAVAAPASGADWVFGLGVTDFNADGAAESVEIAAEWHGRPFARFGPIALRPALSVVGHTRGDVWGGGGVHATAPIGDRGWFVESAVMPGLYDEALAVNDLGGSFEIRSLLGLGYGFANGTGVSAAFEHSSNAGTGVRNPGLNVVALRLHRSF